MKLIKFTLTGNLGNPVYVNPDQVVSVTPHENYTSILTTALNKGGDGKSISVKQNGETVAAMLQGV